MNLMEFFIFAPLVIAYFILGLLYPYLAVDIIKFILFQLFFLILPGFIFSKWFISEELTKIQKAFFGYPVSMVLIFVLSWIGNLMHIMYLEAVILIFSILAIYKAIGEGEYLRETENRKSILTNVILYIGCIIVVFRMFIIPSSPPTPGHLGLFYQDSLWNLGNTWTYIRGFPLQDAKFVDVPFGYHMLKNIYQATVYKYTKIDPFNIHFAIEPISDWFIMVFLVFWGAIKFAKFTLRQAIIFCAGLFFCSAFLGSGLQLHLFINPLTTYFSLPPFILFVFCIMAYLKNKGKLEIPYLTVLYLYFTSTKSLLGIIIPIVLLVLFILNLFNKRIPFSFKQVLLGFNMFIVAILLKWTIFQNTILSLNYDYDTSKSLVYGVFKNTAFLKDYAGLIYPVYRYFSSFIRNLFSYTLNWPVVLFCILLFTSKPFRKRISEERNPIAFVTVFFLVIISMMCLFDFPGIRVYYYWYAQLIFLFLGVFALDYILDYPSRIYRLFAFLLVILSLVSCLRDLRHWVRVGWAALPQDKGRIWDERASISYGEWEGMQWLKKNTAPDKIFFSDRRFFAHEISRVDLPRFYGYAVLSGRQAFAEGETLEAPDSYKAIAFKRWDVINKFLSSRSLPEQTQLLKNIKAGYFIQSLRFNKRDFSTLNSLQLVYSNDDLKIYKILRDE